MTNEKNSAAIEQSCDIKRKKLLPRIVLTMKILEKKDRSLFDFDPPLNSSKSLTVTWGGGVGGNLFYIILINACIITEEEI